VAITESQANTITEEIERVCGEVRPLPTIDVVKVEAGLALRIHERHTVSRETALGTARTLRRTLTEVQPPRWVSGQGGEYWESVWREES
jgi:hypothetical protein